MARNYPLKRIRYWYAYDVDEVCSLYKDLKLHPQTVLGWIRHGLDTVDGSKPFIVMGQNLIDFLGNRNKAQKNKTQIHEIFCMSCKDIKTPYRKRITITKKGNLHNMKAICPDCKSRMNQGFSLEAYPILKKIYAVVDVSQLYDSEPSPDSTHLLAQDGLQQSEPVQGELFA